MIPPSDMRADPPSLTPEERALAQRLARLGAHGEPSLVLDARILAAAHDAVARAPVRVPRRRWPVVIGVAASLALAVGIAWQLQPLPDATPAYQSEAASAAPVAASVADADAAADRAAAPAASTSQVIAGKVAETPEMSATAGTSLPAKPAPIAMPVAAPAPPVAAPPPAEPAIVFDVPEATPAPAQRAAASTGGQPRAFEVVPVPAQAAAMSAAGDQPQAKSTSRTPTLDEAAAAAQTDTLDRLQASGTHNPEASDEPGADVPPATMESPQVRDAWLARIRELAAAGNRDQARASLHEFRRRYPEYPLPDDLRALDK
ncbi:MAG TPA: hypothetical protein VHF02_00305 [Luteimonas sp.]|nr:hypothetical protein [Luteimonas sp.]